MSGLAESGEHYLMASDRGGTGVEQRVAGGYHGLLNTVRRGIGDAGRVGLLLEPGKLMSVLRFVDGVCDYVLSPTFDYSPGHPQTKLAGTLSSMWMSSKGLDVLLLRRLRRLFVGDESLAPAGYTRSADTIRAQARVCAKMLRDRKCTRQGR